MIELNRTLPQPLAFGTQISMDIAGDEEVLALLAEARVDCLFIGVESVNKESLAQAHKLQNCRLDLVESIKKIQSYGLTVLGSLIVGFDQDDATIFRRQFEFLQEACLPGVNIRVLSAIPGTRLWARLHKEGRVLDEFCLQRATGHITKWAVTNAVPKQMTLAELLSGYRDLLVKVFEWDNFEARLAGMLRLIERRALARPRRRWGRLARSAPGDGRARRGVAVAGGQQAGATNRMALSGRPPYATGAMALSAVGLAPRPAGAAGHVRANPDATPGRQVRRAEDDRGNQRGTPAAGRPGSTAA